MLVKVLVNGYVPVATVAVNFRLSELPGGIPAAVPTMNWETEKVTAEEVKRQVTRKPPTVQPVMVQPVGAFAVNPVTVNWLLDGLETVIVNVWPTAPPNAGLFPVTLTVGRLALAAKIGEAIGIIKSRPEKANSDRIVPELSFVTYAFEGVFILYFRSSGPGQLI